MARRNTKGFKELQRYWYAKLEKSGFKDIERIEGILKSNPAVERGRIDFERYEAKLTYFILASQLLHTYSFKNTTEKLIWELHSEGLTLREIEAKIRKYKKDMIHKVITKIALEIVKK